MSGGRVHGEDIAQRHGGHGGRRNGGKYKTIMNDRKGFGKTSKKVIFPAPPPHSEMDKPYFELRDSIITRIKETRLRVIIQANAGMIELYWNIGNDILRRQEAEGWGAKVIDRLSADLKEEFPDMDGFSPRNLKYMRKFAENWTDLQIVQQAVAHLQWRSIIILLTKIKDNADREWYAQKSLKYGWSSFEPGDVSQLNMYQNIVNDILRHPDDKPTIGLLLVKGKNRTVVEYSLSGYTNPIGVADWQNEITAAMPDDLKSSLPTIEEIEREMEFVENQIGTITSKEND